MSWIDLGALIGRKGLERKDAGFSIGERGAARFTDMTSPRTMIREGYKQNSAVFACIGALVFAFREPPLRVYNARNEAQNNHPIRKLIRRPNYLMGEDELMSFIITYLGIGGNAYIHKVRSRAGQVVELWPYHSGEIRPVAKGNRWVDHFEYDLGNGETIYIPAEDIIHIKWMPDPERPWLGMAPMIPVSREIDQENETTRFLFALLANDATPRTVMKVAAELSERAVTKLKAEMKAKLGGANRGEPTVLDSGAQIERIALGLDELDLAGLRGVPEARIAAAFRVPPIIAGLNIGLARSTFSNYGEARKSFTEQTLVPLWASVASEIERDLGDEFGIGDDFTVAFDLSKVASLAEGEDALWKRINETAKNRIITVNEARARMGWEAHPEGDVFLSAAPQAMLTADGESDAAKWRIIDVVSRAVRRLPASQARKTLPAGRQRKDPEFSARLAKKEKALASKVAKQIAADYEGVADADGDVDAYDWDASADAIEQMCRDAYEDIMSLSYDDASKLLPEEPSFNVSNPAIKKTINGLAKEIRGVSDTTRDDVLGLVDQATENGWSIGELAKQIREKGVTDSPERSVTIARTETATAYNLGGLLAYEETGIEHVEVADGEDDEECAAANGQIWTIEEARANPIAHPKCTRAFLPVVE